MTDLAKPVGLTLTHSDLDPKKSSDPLVQNLQFFSWAHSQVPTGMSGLVACPKVHCHNIGEQVTGFLASSNSQPLCSLYY